MSNATPKPLPSEAEMNSLTPVQWQEMVRSQAATIKALQRRLAWFENPQQLALAELLSAEKKAASAKVRAVAAHTCRVREDDVGEAESVPFFDETRVPVETIAALTRMRRVWPPISTMSSPTR
jgi:hypothetical protein